MEVKYSLPYLKLNNNKGDYLSASIDLLITDESCILLASLIGSQKKMYEMSKVFKEKRQEFEIKDRLNEHLNKIIRTGYQGYFDVAIAKNEDVYQLMATSARDIDDILINYDNLPLEQLLMYYLQQKKFIPATMDMVKELLMVNGKQPNNYMKFIYPLKVYSSNPALKKLTAYRFDINNFNEFLRTVVVKGNPNDNFDWDSIETIDDYTMTFINQISKKVKDSVKPRYHKDVPVNDIIFQGTKKPFKGQVKMIGACTEVLKAEKFCYLSAEQGTGKTLMSIKTVIAYFNEMKIPNPTIFILCPATTTEQWEKEILDCVMNSQEVDVLTIEDTSHFINLFEKTNLNFDKATFILCSKENFKLEYEKNPVYIKNKLLEKISKNNLDFSFDLNEQDPLFCPECKKILYYSTKEGDVLLQESDFKKRNEKNAKCPHCQTSLWTATYKKTKKTSVIDFIKKRRIRLPFVIIDEMQESNNVDSLIGMGTNKLLRNHCKKSLLLSGTPNNGFASSLYNALLALIPKSLEEDKIYNIKDFIDRYGTLEAAVKKEECLFTPDGEPIIPKNKFREVEGINPLVFTKYLSRNLVSAELLDICSDLPPLKEFYIPIYPQSTLKSSENQFFDAMSKAQCIRQLGSSILRHYVNNPFGWTPVDLYDTKYQPNNLSTIDLLDKEKELISIIKKELAEGRKCMIYVEFNDKGGKYMESETVPNRLISLLKNEGIDVFNLKRSTCKNSERREVLEKASQTYSVFMCNRNLVSVGLNLQFCQTYINYIPSFMVNAVEQANRRGWRANTTLENRVYHLYYEGVYEERAIKKYQRKKAESNAIVGKFNVTIESEDIRTASKSAKAIDSNILGSIETNDVEFVTKPMNILSFVKTNDNKPLVEEIKISKSIKINELDINNASNQSSQLNILDLPIFATFVDKTSKKTSKRTNANQIDLFSLMA